MTLARTALRMAACAALRADPVIAALCPNRVFDSRIDELDAKDPVPVIVVLTEDDHGRAWSANNGGPPFDHACDLYLEISLRVVTQASPDGDIAIGLPETDAEAEATIDLIEALAVDAVTIADTPQARLIRDAVTRRATELKSVRFATAECGSKLALRMVNLTTHLKVDEPDPLNPPTGPFAALPQPLRAVAQSLPPGSARDLCTALAGKLTPPVPVPESSSVALEPSGLDLTIGFPRDPAAPDPTADPAPIAVSIDP